MQSRRRSKRVAAAAQEGQGFASGRGQEAPQLLDVLTNDELACVFDFFTTSTDLCMAAASCKTFRQLSQQATVLLNLQLEPRENPVFHPTRQAFLGRLADAGNAHACYRLAMGCAYHPRSLHDRASPLEEAMRLLRRAISIGEESIRADAAYELWLLTRRLPNLADDPEDLLTLAIATGSIPARFAAHRSRNGVRRPVHFTISPEYHAAQEFLVAALDEVPFDPVRFSVCRNPGCGRWGVRAREVRRRFDEGLPALGAPPSLPRCQGVAGASCHTRYCSRYCQAMHWPKHRAECGPAMLAHGDF